jgi:hypothetical protein
MPGVIMIDMSALFLDTHPNAEAVLKRLLCEAPPWRKLEMADQLNQAVNLLALTGLRQCFPGKNVDQIRGRLAEFLPGSIINL